MASQIRNRFKILLAQKEARDGRNYTYNDISQATGIAPNTLSAYANQGVSRFDESILVRLCEFFDCTLAELLEYPPVTSQQNGIASFVMAA